jgi:hypothetical protein
MMPAVSLYKSTGWELWKKGFPPTDAQEQFGGEFLTNDGQPLYEAHFR